MRSRRLSNLASSTVLGCLLVAGCARPRVQREVIAPGTPSRIEGPALVLLPRTCVLGQDASARARGRGARTTLELRRAVDAMVAGVQSTALPADACTPTPELTNGAARLSELHASDDVLRMMKELGARHAVVIQVETTLVCADAAGSGLYAGGGMGMSAHVARDACDEEKVHLSAVVFSDDGAAVWAGRRAIRPGVPVERAVEHLLRRVPVPIPLRSRR